MIPVTLAQAEVWRHRVPRVVLVGVQVITVLAAVVVEIAVDAGPCTVEDPCRAPLESWRYWWGGPAKLFVLLGWLVAFLTPRVTIWVLSGVALALATVLADTASLPPAWLGCGLVLAVVGAVDALNRKRQRLVSADWTSARRQLPGSAKLPRDLDSRGFAVAALVISLVLAGGLVVLHDHQYRRVLSAEARSTDATGTVISAATDHDGLVVRLDDESAVLVVPGSGQQPGDPVVVRADPDDPGRGWLVSDPPDPSWLLGLAALTILVGLAAAVPWWARGWHRQHLLRHGGPLQTLRVRQGGDGLTFAAYDDRFFLRPLAIAENLWPLQTMPYRPRRLLAGKISPPVSSVYVAPPDWPQPHRGGSVVNVVGVLADGLPVALVDEHGDAYLSGTALRDPWPWRERRRWFDGGVPYARRAKW